jgi:dTDP-4-dehydrorhamnose reductase
MRVAVTGANGRLGSALVAALADAPFPGPGGPLAWTRADFDLDAPGGVGAVLDRDRPEVVVHTAAWTDVDGCARDPDLAMKRNATATGILARACAVRSIDFVLVSTNEVFDGRRTDGRGYEPGDERRPINAYGRSKLAAEEIVAGVYEDLLAARRVGADFMIARTAWLFGPGSPDFPTKIARAARDAGAAGRPLRVVGDEIGTPTYTLDVAEAIVEWLAELRDEGVVGIDHLVNSGTASRADWARDVVQRAGIDVEIEEVPSSTWERASTPPAWGVLAPTRLPSGEPIRPWQQAMADYAPALRRAIAGSSR